MIKKADPCSYVAGHHTCGYLETKCQIYLEVELQLHQCEKQLVHWIQLSGTVMFGLAFLGPPVVQVIDNWPQKLKKGQEDHIRREFRIETYELIIIFYLLDSKWTLRLRYLLFLERAILCFQYLDPCYQSSVD